MLIKNYQHLEKNREQTHAIAKKGGVAIGLFVGILFQSSGTVNTAHIV